MVDSSRFAGGITVEMEENIIHFSRVASFTLYCGNNYLKYIIADLNAKVAKKIIIQITQSLR